MEKLVLRIRKKFAADPSIKWVDLNISESSGVTPPSVLSLLETEVDDKYIIKTLPVVRRLYSLSLDKKEKAAVKIRKNLCSLCQTVTSMEVLEMTVDHWYCSCLQCNVVHNLPAPTEALCKKEEVEDAE